jgi:hypothetical protein
MKSEIKELWIDALISGEYEKGTGALREDDTFCCLGVLCDLHRKQSVGAKWVKFEGKHMYLGVNSYLPDEVAIWAGLEEHQDSYNPGYLDKDSGEGLTRLSELNDDGVPFVKIAEIIRDKL